MYQLEKRVDQYYSTSSHIQCTKCRKGQICAQNAKTSTHTEGLIFHWPSNLPSTHYSPTVKIPEEYQWHHKVFSKEQSQRLPNHSIWDHTIELLPGAPNSLPGWLLPLNLKEKAKIHKFVQEHLSQGTICISKFPYAANFFLCQKERWKTSTGAGPSTPKQMDKEEQECLPIIKPSHWSP